MLGVAVASAFDLESTAGHLDEQAASDMLRVDPPVEFTVKRESARKLRIQPAVELRREVSYRFTLVDPADQHEIRSWAFQTESPLRVVQALPADKAVAVPATTGIELTFSHDGVTGVEQRFHIEPAVEGRFETHKRVVVFVPAKLEYRTLYIVTVEPGVGVEGGALTMEQPFSFSFETGSQDGRDDQIQTLAPTFTRLLNESAPANPPVLEGDVGIATFFETPFDPASVARDPDVSITRTIDVDGGGIGEGDLVQIRLDYVIGPQALDGCYQITDLAPSGLRPVSRTVRPYDAGQGDVLYPYLIDGQRVSFCAYRSDVYHPAAYWVRVVTKGDYAVEPAIIQSQQSTKSFNFAPGSAVHVNSDVSSVSPPSFGRARRRRGEPLVASLWQLGAWHARVACESYRAALSRANAGRCPVHCLGWRRLNPSRSGIAARVGV